MKFKVVGTLLICAGSLMQAQAQVRIGEWRDHLSYREAISVTQGAGLAFAATSSAIIGVDLVSGEIQRINKTNLLSDIGISIIRWNDALNMLVVAYGNGNVDLIQGDSKYNLNDIKESNIIGSKAVQDIHFEGSVAYLSCGFGVVVVDLTAREVRETWLLGPGGSQVRTHGVAFFQDSIYVATDNGLYSAWQNNINLTAFNSWTRRNDIPDPSRTINAVISFAGKLLANADGGTDPDTLYAWQGNWQQVPATDGLSNLGFASSPGGQKLMICHGIDVRVYDQDLVQQESTYGYMNGAASVNASEANITALGEHIIADRRFGLVRSPGWDGGQPVQVNGPNDAQVYKMDAAGGQLYVATGAVQGNWTNKFDKFGIYYFIDGSWGYRDPSNAQELGDNNDYGGAVVDIMSVAVHPDDPQRAFVGSWDEGIIEFYDQQVVGHYNASNSSLQNEPGWLPTEKVNVAGMAFDDDGNLWVSNANCDRPISVRMADGNWKNFDDGNVLNGNSLLSEVLVAENGYKWIIRPRGNGLLVFNDNGTITNENDDQYQVLTTFDGQGELPDINVLSMAEDPDGEIWVGTGKGIAVFYNPDAIFSGDDFDAQQILIEQDGNVQILLETEAVSAIEVDGAGRKWIGTESSGAFLISDNGQDQIHHFTVENSPLPSNTILDIEIDGTSGDVFFATDNGIMAYRSDATEGLEKSECASVFPNPVRSSYTGPIAIDGLIADSDVKITDISGNLVFSTTSRGGRAIWPGTDLNGERVATGVYLAMATDRTGKQKCMTKVLVVR